jgi:hypothetical protein
MQNPNRNNTSYGNDAMNRMVTMTDAYGHVSPVVYDKAGVARRGTDSD